MKDVYEFLKDLAANNNRDWMHAHKKQYEAAKNEFKVFVAELIKGISAFDSGVTGLEPKDCIFRVNRDIRFSKDKSPYKTNFGASIMEGGRKSLNPTYYIHIQPGKSFVAGGLYMPEPENLKKIRQEIDYNPEELKKIVQEERFVSAFGAMTGDRLKTTPKGYPKDHPNIELLRMKSFLVSKDLKDQDLISENAVKDVLVAYQVMYPFNRYFSVAIS